MNTSLPIVLLTSALLLAVSCPPPSVLAQTAAAPTVPPAAATASAIPPPRTETLRLKFTVGQTLYYSLVEDTVGSYLEPHGKLTPIASHLEMHLHQTVTDVRDTDSAGLLDFGIDSMTVTVDKQPPTDTPPDPAILANLAKLIVLPSGKLGETLVNPAFNANETLPGEDPARMNVLAGVGELPKTPVGVGDKWKSPVFLGLVGEHTTADLSLTSWETEDAASIAVIKQIIYGKFSTAAGDAVHPAPDMKIAGWASGTRTVRFNVEAGDVESENSLTYMTVLLTPKDDEGKYTGKPTRMWVKVTSKVTRTAPPPPPKS